MKSGSFLGILLACCMALTAVAAEDKGKWECKAGAGGWDCNWSGQGPAPEPEKVEKKTYSEYAPKPAEPEASPQPSAESAARAGIEPQDAKPKPAPAAQSTEPKAQASARAPESAWETSVPRPAPKPAVKPAPARAVAQQPATPEPIQAQKPTPQTMAEDEIDEAPGATAAQETAATKPSAMDKMKSWFGAGEGKATAATSPEVRSQPVANWSDPSDLGHSGTKTGTTPKVATQSQAVQPTPRPEPAQASPPASPPVSTPVPTQAQPAESGGVMGTVKSWFGLGDAKPAAKPQAAPAKSSGMGLDRKVQAVQVHASANRQELDAIVQSHSFAKQTWVMTETRNSAPWYCLLTGPYADLHQALNAIEVMPNSLQQYSPWVRRVSAP